MSKTLFRKLFLSATLSGLLYASVSSPTQATGSFAGNGADDLAGEWTSAWFLGERQVHWCIDLSNDFGVPMATAKTEIERALAKWNHYLRAKGLGDPSSDNLDAPALVLNSRYRETCDDDVDLTFHLGTSNGAIEEWRQRYANPIAFSRAIAYDLNTGFGKGYIWIASGQPSDGASATSLPNWSHLPNLRGILLHELGHVLGCRHVAGTIMAPNIAAVILSARFPTNVRPEADPITTSMTHNRVLDTRAEQEKYDRYRTLMLEHIDYSRELYWRSYSGLTLYNVEVLAPEYTATPYLKAMYRRLTSEEPSGLRLYQKLIVWRGGTEADTIRATLFMADDAIWADVGGNIEDPRVWRFDLHLDPIPREFMQTVADDPVFKRHWQGQQFPRYAPKANRFGRIVRVSRGTQVQAVSWPITMERNRGRFTAPQQWDPVLVQMVIDPGTESSAKMFRAKFADQQVIPDGFFASPGGR